MNEPTVYIVKCNEYYKIGIADDINKRLSGLQTGNPYKIELVKAYRTRAAQTLEKMFHFALKSASLHIRGEWFKMNEATLKLIVEVCEIVERGSLQ